MDANGGSSVSTKMIDIMKNQWGYRKRNIMLILMIMIVTRNKNTTQKEKRKNENKNLDLWSSTTAIIGPGVDAFCTNGGQCLEFVPYRQPYVTLVLFSSY